MKILALVVTVGLLGSCSQEGVVNANRTSVVPPDLETAAIAAGVIQDPNQSEITGLFARDTDRICIVPDARNYRAGVFVDYGEQQICSGSAVATRVGETLHLAFSAVQGCDFDARFDGETIVFPGSLPRACAKLCHGRASLAGVAVSRLSASISEAATLRDSRKRLLCGNE